MPPLFQRFTGHAQSDGNGAQGRSDEQGGFMLSGAWVAADETDLA